MTAIEAITDAPLAADGVPRGQPVLDRLVRLLDLERIEDDIFRGVSPPESPVRVFGGQVAGQSLVAAGRTVPAERGVHSLHSYFIRPGDPSTPIVYLVDRVRDGRSFTTRRVTAVQYGQAIFTLSASFQIDEHGLDHAEPMPEVPGPEAVPGIGDRALACQDRLPPFHLFPRPIDLRYVPEPPWLRGDEPAIPAANRVWMRADGTLPDDELLQVCVLAYASDMTLLDSVYTRHGIHPDRDHRRVASLDHAMWFHRRFRADEWLLYDTSSPSASGGRGIAFGRFFSHDGDLLATVVQEGLVRVAG